MSNTDQGFCCFLRECRDSPGQVKHVLLRNMKSLSRQGWTSEADGTVLQSGLGSPIHEEGKRTKREHGVTTDAPRRGGHVDHGRCTHKDTAFCFSSNKETSKGRRSRRKRSQHPVNQRQVASDHRSPERSSRSSQVSQLRWGVSP